MAPVHLAVAADPEAEPHDEVTEAQVYLEQIAADVAIVSGSRLVVISR
jgi:hypothetical protein